MAITTPADVDAAVAQYQANVGYDGNGSVSQCWEFIAACRSMIGSHPSVWEQAGAKLEFNPQLWQKEMDRAYSWLAYNGNGSNSNSGGVSHLSFGEDFR